jgi:serine phosphatase RsbU (regulator of sigma subunit)
MAGRTEDGSGLRLVQKLVDQSSLGILLSGNSPGQSFRDEDTVSLRLFAHLFDNAYQALQSRRNEKDLIFSLNHRVHQLNSLIDTGIEVTKLDQDVAPHVLALQRAAALTNAAKGKVTVRSGDEILELHNFPEGESGQAEVHSDYRIGSSFDFGGKTYAFELFEKESRAGVMPFDETDQTLLDALARQVHASLENRFLLAQSLEKQKIEQDIAVAAAIQQRILPTTLPQIEGYDIAGVNIPSKSVGGDYYDCIPLPDGKFALAIADVSGKGVPAALLVSSLHAYLSAYLESPFLLLELAQRLNRVINRASTDDKFITAFLAILTPATGELLTLNAGHTPVYLRRVDGSVQEINAGGIPFGMLDIDFPFESQMVQILPGERLLLYTDGITEAANESYTLYDTDRPLKEFFARRTSPKVEEFIRELITDIKAFTGNAPQNDDITALVLIRR